MNQSTGKPDLKRDKRRYVIHLFCSLDENTGSCHYIARIHPWGARSSAHAEIHERVFANEYELVDTINRLLPPGSDVRDVLSHIESPEGFFYVLHLGSDEAVRLGWCR